MDYGDGSGDNRAAGGATGWKHETKAFSFPPPLTGHDGALGEVPREEVVVDGHVLQPDGFA